MTESMTAMIAQALNLEPHIPAAVIPQALPFAIINGATAPMGAVGRECRAVHPSNGFVIINDGHTQGTTSAQATTGTLISTDEGTSNTFQTSVFVPSIREVTADTNPILTRIEITYKGYYDPETCRMISADDTDAMLKQLGLIKADEDEPIKHSILAANLYTYCLNNPAIHHDPTGEYGYELALVGAGAASAFFATTGSVAGTNFWNPIGWIAGGVLVVGALVWAGITIYNNHQAKQVATAKINSANMSRKVSDILKDKKASIMRAPLPKGTPGWEAIMGYTLKQIYDLAQKGDSGFKTFWKLLSQARFNK